MKATLRGIKANITAPGDIKVHLGRADYIGVSNIFRIFFDVFLSLSSGLIGAMIALPSISKLHWLFLVVASCATVIFAWLAFFYHKEAMK